MVAGHPSDPGDALFVRALKVFTTALPEGGSNVRCADSQPTRRPAGVPSSDHISGSWSRRPAIDVRRSRGGRSTISSCCMKAQTQTIEQLSRVLDVDERKVSRAARRVLGLSASMVRDPALALSRSHCRQIAQALGKPDPWASASRAFALSNPTAARRPVLKRDPCAKGELTFGSLPHGLWVHPEVPDGLGGMTPLRQRLGIVLQHLAAHGRTTVVKGCRDAVNRGWRRSPLGGSGGMQYYLWWTVQGSRPARGDCVPRPRGRPRARGPPPRRPRASRRRGPRRLPAVLAARDRGRRPRRAALDSGPVAVHTARRPGASGARSARVREDNGVVEGGRGAKRASACCT